MNHNIYDNRIVWFTAPILLSIIMLQVVLAYLILPQYTDDEKLVEYVTIGTYVLFAAVAASAVIIYTRRIRKIRKDMDEDFNRIRLQKDEIVKLPPHEFLKESEALKDKVYRIRDKYIPDETQDTTKD